VGNTRFLFDEPHYIIDKKCLAGTNTSWKLGDKSNLAELFMCGSKNANILWKGDNLYQRYDFTQHICAQKYLIKCIELVKPKVIVSFGWLTMQWFQVRFANELKRNMNLLDNGVPPFFRNLIKAGHDRHLSTLILSLHPNARKFDFNKQEELLAKNVGF